MADVWGGTTPALALKSCSDSASGGGFPRAKRQKSHHVRGTRSRPGPKPATNLQDEVVDGVRRAMTETLPTWMKELEDKTSSLFEIAVSLPHLLACVYWECRLQIDTYRSDAGKKKEERESRIDRTKLLLPERNEAFRVPCQEVVESLALRLMPLLPNTQLRVVVRVLEHTRLPLVVTGYLGVMLDAMLQHPTILWTNDIGMERRFDPEIHSAVVSAGGLLAGDMCLVIFPSAVVKELPRSERSKTDEGQRGGPLTKRYVLPVPPPKDMEEMLTDAGRA